MIQILEKLMGVSALTDQVIATDLIISSKAGVRNYAFAVTEAATPEVRAVLRSQLREAIGMHQELTAYMVERGWYHPFNAMEQIEQDLKTGDTALKAAKKAGAPIST